MNQPRLTRRKFLAVTGAGVGALALSSCSGQPSPTRLVPTFPRAASTGRVHHYTFEAAPSQMSLGSQSISTWTYNSMLPGPPIRLVEGDTLRVTVKNRLPAETTIHWHGVPLINAMDGVPGVTQPAIQAGTDFTYDFVIPTAGTYFYHPHVGVQLDRGLSGPLIVDAARETLAYDQDITLLLDDWLDGMPATPDDALKQLIANGDQMSGMGNTNGMGNSGTIPPDIVYPLYLINGKTPDDPFVMTASRGQKLRLRFINASSATIYRIALQGHRLSVTHTDGQPVEPVEVETLRIGMGERYDVLVTANHAGVWQLAAQAEGTNKMARAILRYKGQTDAFPPAMFQPGELMGQMLQYTMLKAAAGLVVPPNWNPDQSLPLLLSGGGGRYVWAINNQVFPKAEPIAIPRERLIRFQLANQSMMPHPMHLHGHFFQLENGTGRGPLKDTVLIDAMQRMTLNWVSDNPGQWAFHCHNIYHAETGMMRVVSIR